MHVADALKVVRRLRRHVHPLPADDSGRTRRRRERRDALLGRERGENLERGGLERIPGKDRLGDTVLGVDGRAAAPHRIVVHARQVVVDERVGMQQFDRNCGAKRGLRIAANGLADGEAHHRARPLAAAQHRVAHRFDERLRRVSGAERAVRAERVGKPFFRKIAQSPRPLGEGGGRPVVFLFCGR